MAQALLPPEARLRREAAGRLLERLLLLAIVATLLWGPRRGSPPEGPPPLLAVDLAFDPFERLLLLPGVGRTRAAALLEARARDGAPADVAALERVPGFSRARLVALARTTQVQVLLRGRTLALPDGAPADPPTPPAGR